jgi:hypothetical protein
MQALLCFCAVVSFAGSSLAFADEARMSAETFYALTTRLMTNRSLHEKTIENCSSTALKSLDLKARSSLAKSAGMSAEKAVHESCRRLVKGIAAGKITYTTYTQWMDVGGPATISLPDYK